jgi:hypothetical protein
LRADALPFLPEEITNVKSLDSLHAPRATAAVTQLPWMDFPAIKMPDEEWPA